MFSAVALVVAVSADFGPRDRVAREGHNASNATANDTNVTDSTGAPTPAPTDAPTANATNGPTPKWNTGNQYSAEALTRFAPSADRLADFFEDAVAAAAAITACDSDFDDLVDAMNAADPARRERRAAHAANCVVYLAAKQCDKLPARRSRRAGHSATPVCTAFDVTPPPPSSGSVVAASAAAVAAAVAQSMLF